MTESITEEICRETCAVKGEPPCFQIDADEGKPFGPCPECVAITALVGEREASAHLAGMEAAVPLLNAVEAMPSPCDCIVEQGVSGFTHTMCDCGEDSRLNAAEAWCKAANAAVAIRAAIKAK